MGAITDLLSNAFTISNQNRTVGNIIDNAPEIPSVEETLAQTRQLVQRSFTPKPFSGGLATAPFGIAAPEPGSIGTRKVLTGE